MSDHLLDLLVAETRDYAIFMLEVDGTVATWNPGAERFAGYHADEIIGRHFSAFYPPEAAASGQPLRELQVAATAGRFEGESWRMRKDGTRLLANVVMTALRDDDGTLRGFVEVAQDLTERRDRKLLARYDRFKRRVQDVQDYASFMLDTDGTVASWNAGAERVESDQTDVGLGSFSQEITNRARADKLARQLASIVASTDDAVIGKTIAGEITSWNAAAERMYGYSAREAIGHNIRLIAPTDRDDEFRAIIEKLQAGDRIELETVRQRKDGCLVEVSLTISPILDSSAEVIGASTIARDQTQKNALARQNATSERLLRTQLAGSERLLRATIEHAPIGISVFTRERKPLSANAALCRMTGYNEADLLARGAHGLYHPDDEKLLSWRLAPLLAGNVEQVAFEMQYVRADGTTRWAEFVIAAVPDERGRPEHFVSQVRDINERRAHEALLATHASEQEALRALATLVASEAGPREIHAAAAQRVAEVLNADSGEVACLEPTGEGRLVGSWTAAGFPAAQVGTLLDLHDPTAASATLRTGLATNIARYDNPLGETPLPLRSGLAAPITVNGAMWGAISVGWAREAVAGPHAGELIGRVADLVSLAISSADAREQLSLLASTDHLTGLYNQRAFFDRLENEVSRSRRTKRPVSLVVLDLDHFKLVNDTHGHDAGNNALVEFSQRLLSLRRRGEILARVGGEEFAWILPNTSGEEAKNAADRAREAIADPEFEGIGRLTTSLGVCSLDDAHDARELFRHADLALYWSKSNGRNTSTRYNPTELSLVSAEQQKDRLRHAQALAAVRALASAVDAKDPATQRHSERVAALAARLAAAAGWPEERIAMLKEAALVHDVGKIAVPDAVLLKPHTLTDTEYDQVKTHPVLGAQMLTDLLDPEQIDWIRHHHERHDGTGYPDRLAGDAIPEGAGILALADAWDAMTVARSYGAPRDTRDALREVKRNSGLQFCPQAVTLLVHAYNRGELPDESI